MPLGKVNRLRSDYFAIVQQLENFAYRSRSAKAFIAVSEKLKRELKQYHDLDHQVTMIHHGIDLETFHPANRLRFRHAIRSELNIAEDQCVALYVGDWQKAGSTLLRSLQQANSIHLVAVTKSNRTLLLREICDAKLSERVTLVQSTQEINRYYAAADLFVFPSYYDTFGMVVAEAMATGLPVIVSRQTGASEWIEHESTGWIVESALDANAFGHAMNCMASDAALRLQLGTAARLTAENHDWDRVANKTLDVYRGILSPEGRSFLKRR